MSGAYRKIISEEAAWNTADKFEGGNTGHRPASRAATSRSRRSTLQRHPRRHGAASKPAACRSKCTTTKWRPPASAKSAPSSTRLVQRADRPRSSSTSVQNVAHQYGKTATFMPKPIVGDNGSGMHVHQSIWKDGKNLFAGDGYAGLSETALYYIGGIIKHARALNAITNPGTNSYKRLVPHYEAPVKLAYSAATARPRSASPTSPTRRPAASRPASRIPWPTRTCASPR